MNALEMTVPIAYTCNWCKIRLREIQVRARGAQEDVTDWMHDAVIAVGADHHIQSPKCRAPDVDLCIPMANAGARVGAPTAQ